MFEAPLPNLQELHEDAEVYRVMLASGMLAVPDQVNLSNHLRGIENSISFIERMGS
jgi:hypothetical protein